MYPSILLSSQGEEPFSIGQPYIPLTSYHSTGNNGAWAALIVPGVRVNGTDIYTDVFFSLFADNTFTLDSAKKLNEEEAILFRKIRSRPCGLVATLERFSAYRNAVKKGTYCLSKSFRTVEGDRIVTYLFIEDKSIQTISDFRTDHNGDSNHPFSSALWESVEFGYMDENKFIKETTLSDIKFDREYILKLIGKNGIDGIY
jgi:hypothetical protein